MNAGLLLNVQIVACIGKYVIGWIGCHRLLTKTLFPRLPAGRSHHCGNKGLERLLLAFSFPSTDHPL